MKYKDIGTNRCMERILLDKEREHLQLKKNSNMAVLGGSWICMPIFVLIGLLMLQAWPFKMLIF